MEDLPADLEEAEEAQVAEEGWIEVAAGGLICGGREEEASWIS